MSDDKAGHNLTKLKQDVVEGIEAIERFKGQRTSANEEISAIRETLASKGIPKQALDMAMKYKNMDPDKREGFDTAYDIVREAIGLPFSSQPDLFAQNTAEAQDEDISSQMDDGEEDETPAGDEPEGSDEEQEEFNKEVDEAVG